MRAFHSLWTKPYFTRRPDGAFAFDDFELLTTALSALLWRRENGEIDLYCDRIGAAYFDSLGLLPLWNHVFPVLDDMPDGIDADCFWAAGKLYALQQVKEPVMMIDTDFIVWKPLAPLLAGHPLVVIHREPLMDEIYPDPHGFSVQPAFDPDAYDLTVPAANTALSWFGDPAFTAEYTALALDFMQRAQPHGDRLTYMVFAEQRLLPMLAAKKGMPLAAFSDLGALFYSNQQLFTHTWGYKNMLRADPAERKAFCSRCAARLQREFPEVAAIIAKIKGLELYFQA